MMVQFRITAASEIFHLLAVANGNAAAGIVDEPFFAHIKSDARDARAIDSECSGDLLVREL